MKCILHNEHSNTTRFNSINRDLQIYEKIYDEYIYSVYKYVYSKIQNKQDAEDITSTIFVSIFQALPKYKHKNNLSGWIFTIAHNSITDFFRKNAKVDNLELFENIEDKVNVLSEIINKEEINELMKVIASLSKDEKEIICLRYVAELKYSDIASILDINENKAKKTVYGLHKRLRKLLENGYE